MGRRRAAAVVLAGGLGARMRSDTPKHLHEILGRRLIDWVLAAVDRLDADPVVLVTSPAAESSLAGTLPPGVTMAVQPEPRGTGDALLRARPFLGGTDRVVVVPGDTPLLTGALLADFASAYDESAHALVLSFEPDEPGAYGRVIRDDEGRMREIVEAGDATAEQLSLTEVNSSIYLFSLPGLWDVLDATGTDNVQGELYLTDAVALLVESGRRVCAHVASDASVLEGVNTRAELAAATAALRDRILGAHLDAGVTIVDPATTWVDADVTIEPDVVIQPFTVLRGTTAVGAAAQVGPHVVAIDATVGQRATVGPFAYLRPGADLGEGSKVGTFVEVKQSRIGRGTKGPHLSYIGDAEIGEGTNIGAGAITANYRAELGGTKEKTRIGDNVHTGSHNVFVAPIEIGDGAYVGAGSTITKDVPPGALAVARSRQIVKEGYRGGRARE
ncbi:MAG: bifunctional UDP-N-acetylglucosamine diphosphorylase/glucosamine-1-phosphate N-acetyltransferase GlmU [Gaiellales bacterium]